VRDRKRRASADDVEQEGEDDGDELTQVSFSTLLAVFPACGASAAAPSAASIYVEHQKPAKVSRPEKRAEREERRT
jgi:hypothetical protein